jgi:hypothetical protein
MHAATRATPWLVPVLLILAGIIALALSARTGGHPIAATYFHD